MTADSREAPENPLVSIGVPVLNERKLIQAHLKQLLEQSYRPLEIIVSDNCSTDGTRDLVRAIASESPEVKLVVQPERLDVITNFWRTMENATGEYFMWAQPDDGRDSDYINRVVAKLESSPHAVSAMAPDIFASKIGSEGEAWNTFTLEGSQSARVAAFMRFAWKSSGVFGGLHRRDILSRFPGRPALLPGDWIVNLWLVKHGEILRTESGRHVVGDSGRSNRRERFSMYRKSGLDWIVPFRHAWAQTGSWDWDRRSERILKRGWLRLNASFALKQIRFEARAALHPRAEAREFSR